MSSDMTEVGPDCIFGDGSGSVKSQPYSNSMARNHSDFRSTSSYRSAYPSMETLPEDSEVFEIQPQTRVNLTVRNKWKVDEQLHSKMLASSKPSVLIPVAKWISTILMAVGLIACLGASKFSTLMIAMSLNSSAPAVATPATRTQATHLFLQLFLILEVPYLLSFVRASFNSLFRPDMAWPSCKSILLGMFTALLESFGITLFVLKVFVMYDLDESVILTNCIFLFPFCGNLFFFVTREYKENRNRTMLICLGVGTVLQIATVIASLLMLILRSGHTVTWHPFVSLVSLSVVWVPALHEQILKHKVIEELQLDPRRVVNVSSNYGSMSSSRNSSPTSRSASSSHATSYGSSGFLSGDTSLNAENPPPSPKPTDTTWKMTIISSFIKMLGVVIFSFIFFYVDGMVYQKDQIFTESTYTEFKEAWTFEWDGDTKQFTVNLITSLGGYILCLVACHISVEKWAFAIPMLLMVPLSFIVVTVQEVCDKFLPVEACSKAHDSIPFTVPLAVLFGLAFILAMIYPIFRSKKTFLQAESKIIWMPSYNGVLLEHWMILNRRTAMRHPDPPKKIGKPISSRVYICTTMYRENEDEMRQLLESIHHINIARRSQDRFFESHIILDGGVKNTNISEFALQLLSLLDETLGIQVENCTKLRTPYGLKLSWPLPCRKRGPSEMLFNIHLKDGLKVKNKKRWSQIMYMSYVIDFLLEGEMDSNCYILTTDADVKFTPDSVEALLDLMQRDQTVGAVCSRTHPMGSGPLVWYQLFEYAIGHWFQKAAEHVLGSVLCAPGCFSVYRCSALKEIVPVYASEVEHAFDFLIKDMGEDRWLCTLMVQTGWRIEYCAASENSTNCPGEFEEFYKQRRRWIASTIANLMLLIKEWRIVHHFNPRVPLLFIAYQGALLFSTLIGPSTVILIVSGGLTYAWGMSAIATVIIQMFMCLGFGVACLYTKDKTQILTAKAFTFIYALVMTAVVVGTAQQVVSDINGNSNNNPGGNDTTTINPFRPSDISMNLPISVTTLYFAAIGGIFIFASILHPKELHCLLHGFWYLLCLPSGYLVLIIYSVCNITDRSWGTREEKTETVVKTGNWYSDIRNVLETIFFCCGSKSKKETETNTVAVQTSARSQSVEHLLSMDTDLDTPAISVDDFTPEPLTPRFAEHQGSLFSDIQEEEEDINLPIPVDKWLPRELHKYVPLFINHGFDNTMFICGMTEDDLKKMGIHIKAHLQFLLTEIQQLPAFEIEYEVPNSVSFWLKNIGLSMYQRKFSKNHIMKSEDLSVLKSFGRKEIEKELRITKAGHIKRLQYAIRKLREPTEAERKAIDMKTKVDGCHMNDVQSTNVGEFDFWQHLIHVSLKPGNKAFGIEGELKARLGDLRNYWLLILVVTNTIWLILITTLASKGDLTVLGANPLGLSFLFIFGSLLVIQFFAMLAHRLSTLIHFLARAPFKYGAPIRTFWSFGENKLRMGPGDDDWEAIATVKRDERRIREATRRRKKGMSRSGGVTDETPLLREDVI